MRIGLARDCVGQVRHAAGVGRGAAAGETGDGKVEAAPEEVGRAGLAEEAGAEQLQHPVGLQEGAPEALGLRAVVDAGLRVLGERDRLGHLVGRRVDINRRSEFDQRRHHRRIEGRHRHRLQRQDPRVAIGARAQALADEVELDLQRPRAMDQAGGEPARRDVERDLPGVVQPGRQRHAHLADHLGPPVQRAAGVRPFGIGQRRPGFGGCGVRHRGPDDIAPGARLRPRRSGTGAAWRT